LISVDSKYVLFSSGFKFILKSLLFGLTIDRNYDDYMLGTFKIFTVKAKSLLSVIYWSATVVVFSIAVE